MTKVGSAMRIQRTRNWKRIFCPERSDSRRVPSDVDANLVRIIKPCWKQPENKYQNRNIMTNHIYATGDYSITNASTYDDSNGSYFYDWSSTEAYENSTNGTWVGLILEASHDLSHEFSDDPLILDLFRTIYSRTVFAQSSFMGSLDSCL